jgi:hypothetical protein
MPNTLRATVASPAQSTNSVLMIRPNRFYPNPETAADNAFQRRAEGDPDELSTAAGAEFDVAVATLRNCGVCVHVFDDTSNPGKPDAVFPNNWISTHHDGRVALFPMYSPLRRHERRPDIVEELRKRYRVTDVIDYSAFENEACYLEGTGSLVLDRVNRIAYVSLSNRSSPKLVRRFAKDFGYEPVAFTSIGLNGKPIYHTNVMMCIGTNFVLVGISMIPNETERTKLRASLEASGKEIVELTPDQVANFAGNAIEVENRQGDRLLVLSDRAVPTFNERQRTVLSRHVCLVPLKLPTIELAGGSARCMIAEIHLPPL